LDLEDVAEFEVDVEADVEVDDNNEPAEENIPNNSTNNNNCCTYREWGHDGMCPRRRTGTIDPIPLLNLSTPSTTVLELFKILFSVEKHEASSHTGNKQGHRRTFVIR
jgi:hypothetical protein